MAIRICRIVAPAPENLLPDNCQRKWFSSWCVRMARNGGSNQALFIVLADIEILELIGIGGAGSERW